MCNGKSQLLYHLAMSTLFFIVYFPKMPLHQISKSLGIGKKTFVPRPPMKVSLFQKPENVVLIQLKIMTSL